MLPVGNLRKYAEVYAQDDGYLTEQFIFTYLGTYICFVIRCLEQIAQQIVRLGFRSLSCIDYVLHVRLKKAVYSQPIGDRYM